MSWYAYAACHGQDPELFFPVGHARRARQQLAAAKRVCARCPVQSLCLEWAVLAGIQHGVWGGMSEEDRRSIRSIGLPPSARPPAPVRR